MEWIKEFQMNKRHQVVFDHFGIKSRDQFKNWDFPEHEVLQMPNVGKKTVSQIKWCKLEAKGDK